MPKAESEDLLPRLQNASVQMPSLSHSELKPVCIIKLLIRPWLHASIDVIMKVKP